MRRAEAEALRKLDPEQRGIAAEEIRLGDWIVERTCPHRHADLAVFGEIDGGELVCTLHGWRFDLETGRCLTADNRGAERPPRRRAERGVVSASTRAPRRWCAGGSGCVSQIMSIARVLRRTHPCDAGWLGTLVIPCTAMPPLKYFGR